MKIGIMSDTHGVLRDSFKMYAKECDYLIHAGDVTTERCYNQLKELGVPMYMVRGNCDQGSWAKYLPQTLSFRIGGRMFYLLHNVSQLPFQLPETDFVIYGHTHHYTTYERHGITYLNPGSAGQSRGEQLSMVILTLEDNGEYSIRHITA